MTHDALRSPPSPFHLRPMTTADLEAVSIIEEMAFSDPWPAAGYRREITENALARYRVLTMKEGGGMERLIGYHGYWMLADEAHISTIAVHPEWRGRGLGQLLLLDLLFMAYGEPATAATLEVRRSNTVAQSLYLKYGFAIVGERRRYYRDREDALIMTAEPLDEKYYQMALSKRDELYQRLVIGHW
ncbi:MAG: ribosomal protein S18-alanine N-acetyltransferase [Chloroflexota bacterium]